MNQKKKILDLLRETRMSGAKVIVMPIEVSLQFDINGGELISNKTTCQRLIGKLIYLTTIRPYITFVVNKLSQYMQSLTMAHISAAQRILRYLQKTTGKGIIFTRSNHLKIEGNSDADWA